ncbi:hypothetical protein [Limosilactobacillus caccae]|uniref:hypothetical protein n=1 Tax=Limosilactobacillus caccae TaxID=1926284 RepID=UPI000970631A|nr:hypothetical protein [Limosilactobacillus caccae]
MQRSLYEMDIENSIALAKEQGLEQGLSQGLEKGLSQGKAAGIKEGRAVGIEEGLSQGKAEERTRGIHNLIYSLERLGTPKATIKQNLMELYQLSSKEAESFLADK